jgi:hypothetical protein
MQLCMGACCSRALVVVVVVVMGVWEQQWRQMLAASHEGCHCAAGGIDWWVDIDVLFVTQGYDGTSQPYDRACTAPHTSQHECQG